MESKIEDQLQAYLGKNAFENNMQVEKDFSALVGALRYLVTQIQITARWCDEEGKAHVETVLQSTNEILTNGR